MEFTSNRAEGATLMSSFYVLVAWHMWVRRKAIFSLADNVRLYVSSGREAPDPFIREMMNTARLRRAQQWLEHVSSWFSVILILTSFWWPTLLNGAMKEALHPMCALLAALYVLVLSVLSSGTEMTRSRIVAINLIICYSLQARMLVVTSTKLFYVVQGLRVLTRTGLGVLVMDWRLSGVVNLSWSLVLIYHHEYQREDPRSVDTSLFVAIETISYVTMQFFLYLLECNLESDIRLRLSMQVHMNLRKAVQNLLSVLCDAELRLSPSLLIQEPSYKVCHMLDPGMDKDGAAGMQGKSIMDFVAKVDRERFRRFLAQDCATSSSSGPPSAIQLQFQDSKGTRFPVQVYQARLSDVTSEDHFGGHVLGIRLSSSFFVEETALSEPHGPTFGPGRPEPPPQKGPIHDPAASDHYISTVVERAISLPEVVSCDIHFYPLDKNMAIKEMHVVFRVKNEQGIRLEPPQLCDLFTSGSRSRLENWIQENCNTYALGNVNYSSIDGPATLQWPSHVGEQVSVLEASNVDIDFMDEGEGMDDSSDEADTVVVSETGDCDIVGVLQLKNFKQVGWSRVHRPVAGKRREEDENVCDGA